MNTNDLSNLELLDTYIDKRDDALFADPFEISLERESQRAKRAVLDRMDENHNKKMALTISDMTAKTAELERLVQAYKNCSDDQNKVNPNTQTQLLLDTLNKAIGELREWHRIPKLLINPNNLKHIEETYKKLSGKDACT